jgi:GTPase SAR1 family protein
MFKISFADDKSIPLVWHVPTSNDYFVGRQEELQILNKIIKKNHKAAIIGPGGIGKTQLAKRYVHNNYHNYEIIWWFDMARSIDDQLNLLAHQLNKPYISSAIDIDKISARAVLLHIKDVLRTTDKSWLIIFDNVKNVDLIEDYIPESHGKSNKDILITTRNSNENLPSLYLKTFTPDEASQFLLQSINISDLSNLNILSELLGFYPLALAQAAAYIKTNNMKISEYISLYNKDPYNLWKSEKQLVQNEGNYFDLNKSTIEAAVSLNFQNIQNESLVALEVIKIISIIKVALIPEYLLKDCIKTSETYKEEEFKAAIRALKKYSLIEEQIKEGKKYYQVHDVVKKIVKKRLTEQTNNFIDLNIHRRISQSELEVTYKKILKVMCMHLNKPWGEMVEYVNANSELINIANTVSFNAYKDKISDPLLIELMISLLEHNNMIFHAKSNYKTYQELAECLYELLEGRKIYAPLILQSRYYFNGIYADFIYQSKEMSDKYEQKLSELLALLEEKPEFIEERFLSLINMAEFCFFRGNITQGIYYINKSHPLLQKISNANYRAQFWYALTWLYIEKGDYLKAHEYIKAFFDVTKNNKSYPIHLYAMNLRASVNFYLNNFKESYLWAEECYKRSMDFFQSDTSNIAAESLITLARYYKSNKDYVRSLEKIQKAINILNIIFSNPEIDPSQAVAHTLLGEIYVAQQQYKQAYDEYSFAEKYYTKLYKNNFSNINEVSRLFGNFVMLGIKTHDKILARRYLRKLVDNFTYKNPTTSMIVKELSKYQLSIME